MAHFLGNILGLMKKVCRIGTQDYFKKKQVKLWFYKLPAAGLELNNQMAEKAKAKKFT